MHADHHCGLIQVVKTAMHEGRTDELVILAPDEGLEPLRRYLEASYLFDYFLGFPIRWVSLKDCSESSYDLPGGARLRAYPNSHLAWFREQPVG